MCTQPLCMRSGWNPATKDETWVQIVQARPTTTNSWKRTELEEVGQELAAPRVTE